jgi:hypothetical protein
MALAVAAAASHTVWTPPVLLRHSQVALVLFEAFVMEVFAALAAVEELDAIEVRLVLADLARLNLAFLADEISSLSCRGVWVDSRKIHLLLKVDLAFHLRLSFRYHLELSELKFCKRVVNTVSILYAQRGQLHEAKAFIRNDLELVESDPFYAFFLVHFEWEEFEKGPYCLLITVAVHPVAQQNADFDLSRPETWHGLALFFLPFLLTIKSFASFAEVADREE